MSFYERVRPPGFWAPFAARLDEESGAGARRLARGLGATGLAAFSIFAVLVSLGSWMLHSPAPVWFPFRAVWICGLLAVGLGLVPLWWRWVAKPSA